MLEAGAPIYHITDQRKVWIRATIPAKDIERFQQPRLTAFNIAGIDTLTSFEPSATKRISADASIDPVSRSIHVFFECGNADRRFRIGMTGNVYLVSGGSRKGITVPVGALLEDEGVYFVYIQTGGESFERKNVVLGDRMGNRVEIAAGLTGGERVVTVGAPMVRIAASSTSLPAHGHVH